MKTAVSIGTFDAIHLGHLSLVQAAKAALGQDGIVEMWSFDPPPSTLLDPSAPFHRITTFEQREKLLYEAGVQKVRLLTPTESLLSQTAESFIQDVVDASTPDYFVEGSGFQFGKNRAGNIEALHKLGAEFGFECIEVPAVEVTLRDHSVVQVSSSMIRWLLGQGRVEDAATMLGRSYALTGIVEKGDQRGRSLGIHTANLGQIQTMFPKEGIYAGKAIVGEYSFPAAISIGTKPTFGVHELTCEAHLLEFDGEEDEYGWQLTLEFTHWLRNQIKFDTVEELTQTIQQDIEMVSSLIES